MIVVGIAAVTVAYGAGFVSCVIWAMWPRGAR